MAEKPPTAEEFEAWLHPSDVIERYHQQRELHPRLLASGMLADGLLRAAARQLILNGRDHGLALIPREIWLFAGESEIWSEGRFKITHVGAKGIITISAYDVRIDPMIRELPPPGPAPVQASGNPPSRAKGGRPAGKHGEPIARVTTRLLAMPPDQLASYTADALAAELVEEYRKLGLPPPSVPNARRDAAGILRAVRN
jgi:hypothetical protein